MTGAEIPSWADAVIQFEDTKFDENNVIFKFKPEKKQYITFKGSYIKKNSLLIIKGDKINKYNLQAILSAGKENIKVYKRPNVGLIVTGDELIDIRKKPKNSEIRDINSYLLKFLLKQNNIKISYFKRVKDNKELIKKEILKSLDKSEIVLIVGGVSMGKFDYVHIIIKELCNEILFHKLYIKPGKPIIIGKYNNKVIIGIPGNPLASLINFEMIIKPIIKKMSGEKKIEPTFIYSYLKNDYEKTDDRLEFIPGLFLSKNNENYFILNNFKDSGDISSIINSNGIGILEGAKNSIIKKGTKIKVVVDN